MPPNLRLASLCAAVVRGPPAVVSPPVSLNMSMHMSLHMSMHMSILPWCRGSDKDPKVAYFFFRAVHNFYFGDEQSGHRGVRKLEAGQ